VNRWLLCLLCAAGVLSFARRCPAPIIFRPGEGWTYEPVGQTGKWERNRAKDQLQVAQEAFDKQEYGIALKASRRVVKVWPLSDHAGPAQFLLGRVYEARGQDEKAFKEYQRALTLHPKLANYPDVVQRQLGIGNRFLAGQWFKLWGYVPFFPSMDKTAGLFESVVKNGPYHPTGPIAQMSIGTTREKQKNYPLAVKAYERAADRYYDRPEIASDALYRAGMAWNRQAKRAEYDQSASSKSIDAMNDFKALYPTDKRVPDATAVVLDLKTEQARGAYETGRFYERYRRYQGAIVYYNEVLVKDAQSPYAEKARERIEALKPLAAEQMRKYNAAEKKRLEATRAAAQGPGTKPAKTPAEPKPEPKPAPAANPGTAKP
jgi:outer membrane protein assembly factor BamD (BamD/ComL family)